MENPLTCTVSLEIQLTRIKISQKPILNLTSACSQFFTPDGHLQGHLIHKREVEIGREIGKGSYGSVRIGIYCHMQVAIKIIRKNWSDLSQVEKSRCLKEVSIATELNQHQNVLRVYGYMKAPHLAIVSEYCEKGSVLDYINNPGNPRLDNPQKFEIAIGITKGLNFIHKNNVIHRDLAARNVLLHEDTKGFKPRIADFGMARRLEEKIQSEDSCLSPVVHKTSNYIGPVKWMSPEALKGESSKMTDI